MSDEWLVQNFAMISLPLMMIHRNDYPRIHMLLEVIIIGQRVWVVVRKKWKISPVN